MLPTQFIRALSCAALTCACSQQGEGERCDTNSYSQDCESGLVCRSSDQLAVEIQGRGVALCCPPDGVVATVDACRAGAQFPEEEVTPTPTVDAGDGGL